MFKRLLFAAAVALAPVAAAHAAGPTDPQIAHIAYTADNIDIGTGKLALEKSSNPGVRAFATEMVRDHTAVNGQALALVKKLGVTPEDNPTSQPLTAAAAAKMADLGALSGPAFDKAYAANEVAYHQAVNAALKSTLIPAAQNAELKALLETGLKLFESHQAHAEQLAASLH